VNLGDAAAAVEYLEEDIVRVVAPTDGGQRPAERRVPRLQLAQQLGLERQPLLGSSIAEKG